MFNRILIVCIGNICRSPMAAALLQQSAKEQKTNIVVESAGISALVGHPADTTAQVLMQERGLDISAHRARQLTPRMIMDFDLVLAMESGHVKAIENMAPSARGRIYRLGKWGEFDIADPYRKSRQAFEEALVMIERGLKDWLPRIWSG